MPGKKLYFLPSKKYMTISSQVTSAGNDYIKKMEFCLAVA